MPTRRRKRIRSHSNRITRVNLTTGQLNRIIDTVFHRHFGKYPSSILLDGFAHFVVEKNPKESLRKFVRYNVPALLMKAIRNSSSSNRRSKRRKDRRLRFTPEQNNDPS